MSTQRTKLSTLLLFAVLVFIAVNGSIFAANVVEIDCPTDIPVPSQDTTILIDVYFTNEDVLGGFSIGFSYTGDVANDEIEITGVVGGPAIPQPAFIQKKFVPADNQVLIGYLDFGGSAIQPSASPVLAFSLEMEIPAGATVQCINMDSVFVPPAGPFQFSPKTGGAIKPDYVDCGLGDITIGGASCGGSNTAPVANDTAMTVAGTTPTAGQLHANDDDGDDLTYAVDSGPSNGSLTSFDTNTGAFTYQASDACAGSDTFTFTAHDGTDPSNIATVTITIVDNEDPVAICPGEILTGNDTDQCGAVVNFTVNATDNCPGVTVTANPPSGSFFDLGVTPVEVIAIDAAGNADTCYFNVGINDIQDPVAICPGDITVDNDAETCGAVVDFAIDATDNCSISSLVATPPSGSTFSVGTTQVMVVAIDGANNRDTCYFDVTVNDTEFPVAICADPILVAANPGETSAVVNFAGSIGGSDNCGATVVATPASGSAFPLGTTAVEVVATDAAGNADTCYFDVTVKGRPVVAGIPDQILPFGAEFATFDLDDYVTDPDTDPADIGWVFAGETELTVTIDADHVVTITKPDPNWVGSEAINFTATDLDGLADSDEAVFAIGEEPPIISLDPVFFQFTAIKDGSNPANKTLNVNNSGGGTLNWTATNVTGWLSLSAYSGTANSSVDLVVDITGLDVGIFWDTIEVSGNAANSPQPALVKLTIEDIDPELEVTPTSLLFQAALGGSNPASKSFDINNIGGKTLYWGAVANDGFISIDSDTGEAPSTVNVSVDITGLGVGTHNGTITVYSDGTTGSPETVDVTLEISGELCIAATPDTLFFSAFQGDNNPPAQYVNVTDNLTGTEVLDWSASEGASWFDLSAYAGLTPDQVGVGVNTVGLQPGMYTANIFFFDVNTALTLGDPCDSVVVILELTGISFKDTVTVSHEIGIAGEDIIVTVSGANSDELLAYKIPLLYDNGLLEFVGVSFEGTRTNPLYGDFWFDQAQGKVEISADYDGAPLQPGTGVFCYITFAIKGSAELGEIALINNDPTDLIKFNLNLEYGTGVLQPKFNFGSVTIDVSTGVDDDESILPTSFSLNQNYPNPFNPETVIEYSLPHDAFVTISVYNVLGQKVVNLVEGYQSTGDQRVVWDGHDSSGAPAKSGIYFYKLSADGYEMTRKMVLMK